MTNDRQRLKSVIIMRALAFVILLTGICALIPVISMPIRGSLFLMIFYFGAPTIYIFAGIGMILKNELSRKIVLWVTVIEIFRLLYFYSALALSSASIKSGMPENIWIQAYLAFILNGIQIWLLTRTVIKTAFQKS